MFHLSKNITLPPEAITQTFGIVGIKGSGKSYMGGKLFELFYAAGVQCIVVDPVGLWYGLRLNAAGTGPSTITAPVFGGLHGDVPLPQDSGKVIADFLLDSGSSAILDVSQMRKGARKDFVTLLAEELFHVQKKRRVPLHLFIDEAQIFVPQHAGKDEARMLGAFEDIVRLGRNFGIGVTLITQRPQSVNKEVLNQVEPLVVFQLAAAHERKAIMDWIVYSGANVKDELQKLASLQKGDGFFWSPAWMGKFEQFRCLPKKTFDATATPTLGQKAPQPVNLSSADIAGLSAKLQQHIDEAAANDPKVLKTRVAELERQLRVQDKMVTPAEANRIALEAVRADRAERGDAVAADPAAVNALQKILSIAMPFHPRAAERTAAKTTASTPARRTAPSSVQKPSGGPEQRILNALAWWESTGKKAPYSKTHVAFIAGYTPNSGAFNNPLGKLRSGGLIEYPTAGYVDFTEAGRALAEPVTAPATSDELHARVFEKLDGPQRKILAVLIASYPDAVEKAELARLSGYTPNSGAFNNPTGSLRSLGLIDYPRPGQAIAESFLFIEGKTHG